LVELRNSGVADSKHVGWHAGITCGQVSSRQLEQMIDGKKSEPKKRKKFISCGEACCFASKRLQ
jgi:hypothetical protein